MQIFPVLVPLLLPVTQICLTGSLYTVLAVAIERFLAVTRYFYHVSLLFTGYVQFFQPAREARGPEGPVR